MGIPARKLVFALLTFAAGSTSLPVQAEILEAQWQVHQVRFRYVGMNAAYTCDSIENSLTRLLKLLGARDDVRAETSCTGVNQVSRFHRVRLAFAVPVPADKTDMTREIIPAEWKEVKVVGRLSRYLDPGDCELLEQFERQVIPHLQVRNLRRKIHCAPYRREFGNLRLRMMALVPVDKVELEEVENNRQKEDDEAGR